MEEYYKSASGEQMNGMKLPPITPATPSIGNAKKLLRKGNEIVIQSTATNDENDDNQLLNCSDLSIMPQGGFFASPTSRSPLPSVAEGGGGGGVGGGFGCSSYDDYGMSLSMKESMRISSNCNSPRPNHTNTNHGNGNGNNITSNTTCTTPIQQKPSNLFSSNSESYIK